MRTIVQTRIKYEYELLATISIGEVGDQMDEQTDSYS